MLEDKGIPSIVGRTMMRPPSSRLGPITPEERKAIIAASPVSGIYDKLVDRESASEVLVRRNAQRTEQQAYEDKRDQIDDAASRREPASARREPAAPRRRTSNRQSVGEAAVKSFTRSVATRLGTAIVRGILVSISRGFRFWWRLLITP
jgi:hypothetical protein